ncbi:MAG: hypothetical protein ACUVV6_08910, partial [Thermoplasmatota archaeon]
KVKLKPGRHQISLEVSDGQESALAGVDVEVVRREQAATPGGWGPALTLALMGAAAFMGWRGRPSRDRQDLSQKRRSF